MSGAMRATVGALLLIVAGGVALSPLGASVPEWAYGGVLLALVVGLVVASVWRGSRRSGRRVARAPAATDPVPDAQLLAGVQCTSSRYCLMS
jgi:hypothetical protein